LESSCLEVDSHEEHSLADEELHRRQIAKHHVDDQKKESSRSVERKKFKTFVNISAMLEISFWAKS